MSVLPDSIVYRRKQSAGLARDASATTASDDTARPSPASISRNAAWMVAGNLTYAISQWGTLIVLARLGGPEMLGQFASGLAITAPVMMLANLQLRSVQATDAAGEFQFGHYLALRLTTTALALITIGLLAWITSADASTLLVVVIVGLAKAFENTSDVLYGLAQRHERMHAIALSLLLKGPLSVLAISVAVHAWQSAVAASAAFAVALGLILFVCDLPIAAAAIAKKDRASQSLGRLWPRWEAHALKSLAWRSLPLGIVTMLISLNTNIPRYFIEVHLGARELGAFVSLTCFVLVGSMVLNALGQAVSPRLAKYFSQRNVGDYCKLLLRFAGVAVVLAAGGVAMAAWWGRQLVTICYGSQYAAAADDLTAIMAAAVPLYLSSVAGYGLTAARWFTVQAPIFGMTTATTAVACHILIPNYGLRGAALAMAGAGMVQVLLTSAVLFAMLRNHTVRAN